MFELSVALKYLIPRWRELSVSIISLVSILVIALVVWLIVVFFSVKDGLENSWIDKIIALTAPMRLTPTDKYYSSYYHLVDSISEDSNYTTKTIGEKLSKSLTENSAIDPYNPLHDEEIPSHWLAASRTPDGALIDIVGEAYLAATTLSQAKNPKVSDFETTVANIKLRLLRNLNRPGQKTQTFLDQVSYIGTFDTDSATIAKALMPFTNADYHNIIEIQSVSSDNITEDNPSTVLPVAASDLQKRLLNFFSAVQIKSLKTTPHGLKLPISALPKNEKLEVAILLRDQLPAKIYIPTETSELKSLILDLKEELKGRDLALGYLTTFDHALQVTFKDSNNHEVKDLTIPQSVPLILTTSAHFASDVIYDSISTAQKPQDVKFQIQGQIQGFPFTLITPLNRLEIATVQRTKEKPLEYVAGQNSEGGLSLPHDHGFGESILLPKSFREAGVLAGDQGYISYQSATPSSIQEQRVIVQVAGFYDPGIMPIGGKYILASKNLISMVRGAYAEGGIVAGNGLNIRFDNLKDAPKIKRELEEAFAKAGISPYWSIETYQEYEFTKDLIQQLQSEKNLFSVISLVIIIVACSNIISMLIILVNDKKLEIGILRSMGATSGSIALIFGFCGMVMGAMGSLIGIGASLITLKYLNELVGFIGKMQGHDLFNPVFYGNTLPTELSLEALSLVVAATAFISLLAGIVPAVKASALRPSAILKAE